MNIEAFVAGLNLGYWNYVIIFFISFLESIPFLSLLIPGQTLVALAGFATHAYLFNLQTLIIIVAIAAILGDCSAYVLGRKYGLRFLKKWGKYFFFKKEYLHKTERLISNHLGKSLILGRLYSFTRAFTPFLAGAHRAPFSRFLGFTFIGCTLWTLVFVLLGYFIGESFKYVERYLGLIFILVILIALSWNFIKASIKRSYNFFSTESKILGATFIVSFLFFIHILKSVLKGGFWLRLDMTVSNSIGQLHNIFLTLFAQILDILFDPFSLSIISLLVIGALLQNKKKKEALFFTSTMILSLVISEWTKNVVYRPRPTLGLIAASGFSFPSGHALISTVFLGLIAAYVLLGNFSPGIKRFSLLFISLGIMIIGASRVYLGVHWASDVIVGISLGIIILSASVFFWIASERMKARE